MIIYDRLWETMKRKGISQYSLILKLRISASTPKTAQKKHKDAICISPAIRNIWDTPISFLPPQKSSPNSLSCWGSFWLF